MNKFLKIFVLCFLFFFIFFVCAEDALAANVPPISISIGASDSEADPTAVATSLQIAFLLIIISLSPSLILMLTCFTRIIISLHFVRSALGTQQMPPNQVLVGLSLILTFFIMEPQLNIIYNDALMPYSRGELEASEAVSTAMQPLREFMFRQADDKNISLFAGLAGEVYETPDDIPNRVLIPAFVLSEITVGFINGFYIYISFIAIDMIVASTLMAMGMMMLPPAMISLPFKILLFVMADGWNLVIQGVIGAFL